MTCGVWIWALAKQDELNPLRQREVLAAGQVGSVGLAVNSQSQSLSIC